VSALIEAAKNLYQYRALTDLYFSYFGPTILDKNIKHKKRPDNNYLVFFIIYITALSSYRHQPLLD